MTEPRVVLTPLERLQLREALQDRWRDQVRLITELSVDLHTMLDADESDVEAVAVAVSDARLRLGEIEHAMRRLDDRSYGRCFSCLRLLPFSDLICEPETRHCAGCRRTGPTAGVPAIADAG